MTVKLNSAEAGAYPHAAEMINEMERIGGRILGGQVGLLYEKFGEEFLREADRIVGLSNALGGKPADALLDYTVAYLKEQAKYSATGSYSNDDFDTVYREVYDNPDVMDAYYLEGLMLTHAFWLVHFEIHRFFRAEFLPRIPTGASGSELGFGHGLYLLDVLGKRDGTTTVSLDISKYARRFATRLLTAGEIVPGRFELKPADVREPLPFGDGALEWLIFAEVLEHIPDPLSSLREIARVLKTGAPLFVTTVLESNAIDHLYQFESVDQVREMLDLGGFAIETQKVFSIQDLVKGSRDSTVDLAFVCTRK